MWLWCFILNINDYKLLERKFSKGQNRKYKRISQKFSPDIVMMQEIKTQEETYPYDDLKFLKYENYVYGQKSYNGVAIISKKKLSNIKRYF